eukprot:gene50345-11283_t
MSQYGRGMWLWDTGFHVFALLTGGPRALAKAQDQLLVLTTAGRKVGHIPRVVGTAGIETTTQPPGILTWAALVVYNRTQDKAFLSTVYDAFAENNEWFYSNKDYASSSGLCKWRGTDSGWDTSPRWDEGVVEAVDLNGWLHLDHLLLAQMARALGKSAAGTGNATKASKGAALFQSRLWDDDAGVVTPATFWSLLAGIATPAQASRMAAAVLVPGRVPVTAR